MTEAIIEADAALPIIRITRDFTATSAQLIRAHTDPTLFAKWVGPRGMDTEILEWDARSGGAWRYVARRDGEDYGFRGCFHTVSDDVIVQTFTWEGQPDDGRWRRCASRTSATAAPDCTRSPSSTVSRGATDGWLPAWKSGSTTATPSSTSW